MLFRIYIFLIFISVILLFTQFWFIGVIGVFLLVCFWPFGIVDKHKKWKLSQAHIEKSLSFGIQSMRKQKQNFKAVNFVFAKFSLLKSFFKKISIIVDDIHVKYISKIESRSYISNNPINEIVYSPMYRHHSSNVYHTSQLN